MPNGLDSFSLRIDHSIIMQLVLDTFFIVFDQINAQSLGLINLSELSDEKILAALTDQTIDIESVVNKVVTAAQQDIQNDVLTVGAQVQTLGTSLTAAVGENNTLLGGIFSALAQGINVAIENNINVNDSLFGTLLDKVSQVLGQNNRGISEAVGIIGNIFSGNIQEILRNILVESMDEKLLLQKIIEAILTNKPEAAPILDAVLNDGDEGIGAVVTKSAFQTFFDAFSTDEGDLTAATNIVDLDQFARSVDMFCDLLGVLRARPASEATDAIYGVVADILTTVLFPLAMHGADTTRCLAVWSKDNPWKHIEPGDVARMFYLGILDEKDAVTVLTMSGYSIGDAADLLNSAQTIPSIDFIITMWLREKISDDAFHFALKQLGYNEAYAAAIEEIAFFIPPVQDLITMSVREVFDPRLRADNRQDENFPPELAKWAAQQGVTEEWAKNYWAAHWVLPSIQMGFEMLHRDVIDEPKLKDLMQALDVMPGWVDRLIEISFQPITRIDIRRLNSVGLLQDSALRKAYANIGYSPSDAELLSEFTEKLNEQDEIITFDIASDLTRSNIIGFYTDGIINRSVALALLIQAGINLGAAELFMADADFRLERTERKQGISLVLDRFKFTETSFNEAMDMLAQLGLETVELSFAVFDLKALAAQETKLPSRADLDKFLKNDIITDDNYLDMMSRLGYSNVWSRRYMQLATVAN